jgi:hypothetical protein
MAAITGEKITPDFTVSDYVKFFGAGALAATATHGVRTSPVPVFSRTPH